MTRRRTQDERRAATRASLIEATVRALIAHGYAGASVRTIAEDCGVSIGALQHHFATKEELVLAALVHVFDEVSSRLAAVGDLPGSVEDRAERIVDTLWEFYGGRRYLAAAEILMGTRQQSSLHRRVRDCRLLLADAYRRMWDRLMSDTPLEEPERWTLLQFVISTMRGLALLKMHERDPQLYEPPLAWLRALIVRAMTEGGAFLTTEVAARSTHDRDAAPLALV